VSGTGFQGREDRAIFWTLHVSGSLCVLSGLGQVLNIAWLNVLGILAWGPGLIVLMALLAFWLKARPRQPQPQ
jgi:hypothetical protein